MTAAPSESMVEELERLCYAGESIVDAATVSGGTVGVTTHRVVALTPDSEGATFQAVDRPNVTGVAVSTGGDRTYGLQSLRFGVYAAVLLAGSYLVNFEAVDAVDVPAETGAQQIVQMAATTTALLSVVDDILRAAGVVVLLVGLGFAALYGYSRDRCLAIEVDGGDALRLPLVPSERRAADRLSAALEKASNPSDG